MRQDGYLASKHHLPRKQNKKKTNAAREPQKMRHMLNKTTMASINSAQHTQHMEGAEHQRKSERKQTTSSVGSAALSPLAGGSGRGIAASRASGF